MDITYIFIGFALICFSFFCGEKVYAWRLRNKSKNIFKESGNINQSQYIEESKPEQQDVKQTQIIEKQINTVSRIKEEDQLSYIRKQKIFNGLNIEPDMLKLFSLSEESVGKELISQGSESSDVFFILRGKCDIMVNGRKVAERNENECVGEMSAIDPISRRSSSVIVSEQSAIVKVSSEYFLKIMGETSQGWKNLTLILASRLRERNRFHKPPRKSPIVFIASSSEKEEVAKSIKNKLENATKSCEVKLWTDIFSYGDIIIERLISVAKEESDFAICVLSADDEAKFRGRRVWQPRDNVVLEFGIFVGAIGKDRTFMLLPNMEKKTKTPSDLQGITYLSYSVDTEGNIDDESIKKLATEISKKGAL